MPENLRLSEEKHNLPTILRHLKKWWPIYELGGMLSAISGVLVAVVVGGISIKQTQDALHKTMESLRLSQKSVELQEQEFRLRNRPLVVLRNYRFGNEAQDTGHKTWPHTVEFEVANLSEIPANRLSGVTLAMLNGTQTISTEMTPFSLAKEGISTFRVFLSDEMYDAATNNANRFEVRTTVTYSGMLGEKPDAYRTTETVYFSSDRKEFKYAAEEDATYK